MGERGFVRCLREIMSVSLDEFAAKVAAMRALGVLEADGIKLGAPPAPPAPPEETADEWRARLRREAQRRHDILFAASSTRPVMRTSK